MNKKILTLTLAVIALLGACAPSAQQDQKVLRHVVLFKFKDAATPEDVKKIENAFGSLADKISLIKDYEWGTNSSPENLNQGLTHCFLVTFTSDKDRDDYLVHPDHKAFVEVLLPYLDKATVVDYWTK